jgi:hypothetical protein
MKFGYALLIAAPILLVSTGANAQFDIGKLKDIVNQMQQPVDPKDKSATVTKPTAISNGQPATAQQKDNSSDSGIEKLVTGTIKLVSPPQEATFTNPDWTILKTIFPKFSWSKFSSATKDGWKTNTKFEGDDVYIGATGARTMIFESSIEVNNVTTQVHGTPRANVEAWTNFPTLAD